jgi:predicted RecA/RadA family phage recombinase
MEVSKMYIQKGEVIDYKNSGETDIAYGGVVSLTTRIGIAAEKIPAGETGSLRVVGVHELDASNSVEFTVGAALYWDATNKCLTTTSSGNIPAGWCVEAKASAGTSGKIKIG